MIATNCLKYVCLAFFCSLSFSCKESISVDNASLKARKTAIEQNLQLLDQLNGFYYYDNITKENTHDLKIYYDACDRYLNFLKTYKNRLEFHKDKDTTYLIHLYTDAIKEAMAFTDSIKKTDQLKLLAPDKEALLFDSHAELKSYPGIDYELLNLLYLQDFETQITHALSIVHPQHGCLKIIPSKFYDFMIIQNNLINDKIYYISIKNNYMLERGLKDYYTITLKSLRKIIGKDTSFVGTAILPDGKNKVYKSNLIPYEKGNYLLTLNMNYELPSGILKVNEMTYEYELK